MCRSGSWPINALDDLLELQRAFDEAELAGDRDRLNLLIADDFRSIGEQGYVLDKAQWIARHDEFRYLAIDTTELDVHRYGTAAIIRCVQRSSAIWQGNALTLSVRLGQVWVEQSDRWVLAGIQFSSYAPH